MLYKRCESETWPAASLRRARLILVSVSSETLICTLINSPLVPARLLPDDVVLRPTAFFTLFTALHVSDLCNDPDDVDCTAFPSPLFDCEMNVSGFGPALRHAPTRISQAVSRSSDSDKLGATSAKGEGRPSSTGCTCMVFCYCYVLDLEPLTPTSALNSNLFTLFNSFAYLQLTTLH